jgi:hypothetical protein
MRVARAAGGVFPRSAGRPSPRDANIGSKASVYEAFSTASRDLFGDEHARLRPAQRDDGRIVDAAQWRQRSSNRVGYVIRREMRVVLFRDARVGVAELNGDHAHRNGPPR